MTCFNARPGLGELEEDAHLEVGVRHLEDGAGRAAEASKAVGLAQKIQVGPCIPVGNMQLQKLAEVGPAPGPAWRPSHSKPGVSLTLSLSHPKPTGPSPGRAVVGQPEEGHLRGQALLLVADHLHRTGSGRVALAFIRWSGEKQVGVQGVHLNPLSTSAEPPAGSTPAHPP